MYFKNGYDHEFMLIKLKLKLNRMYSKESTMKSYTFWTKEDIINDVYGIDQYECNKGHNNYNLKKEILCYIEKSETDENDDFRLVEKGFDLIVLVDHPSEKLQEYVIKRCIYEIYYLLSKDEIEVSEYTQRTLLELLWTQEMILPKFNNKGFIHSEWFRKMKLKNGPIGKIGEQ